MSIKKILLLCCTAAFMHSCSNDLSYDGETKTVFEGRILDNDNQPLSNILVSIKLQKYDDYQESFIYTGGGHGDSYIISYVRTDENGNYRMIFPMSTNQDNIVLQINAPVNTIAVNEDYSYTLITNIQDENIHLHKLDFGDQQLLKLENKTTLKVTLTDIPEYFYDQNILAGLEGIVANKVIYYNTPNLNYGQNPITGADGTNIEYTFEVAKNQNVVFTYRADANATPHEFTIPIGAEAVNTSIEFQP